MGLSLKYREIPYNYTSFSDREIILRYFDSSCWDMLNQLRRHRVTGRSAKLLFEVIGDIFIIDRNPYIYNDFLKNKKKRLSLKAIHKRKLKTISKGADNDAINTLLVRTQQVVKDFFDSFNEELGFRKKFRSEIGKKIGRENIFFTAFHKIFHSTDATDWRVENPCAVVYPENEDQIRSLILKAAKMGLKIIPRGGGTGLTGGAVPLHPKTVVVNTEKLNKIIGISYVQDEDLNIVEVEAGAITDDVSKYCSEKGFVFATDPTSAWASTIGGNIAENAGGKKALLWGTAIDNLYSYKMVDPQGRVLEICRREHPGRKILPEDQVVFDVYLSQSSSLLKTITLSGLDIRKKGVGKDITNKVLGGLPGLQKEGGDGLIVSAKFLLYKPFLYARTAAFEFYGDNLVNASSAIVRLLEYFAKNDLVYLTALEHFDDKYVKAVLYINKSSRSQTPKAVLLADIESNDLEALEKACAALPGMVLKYNCECFLATDEAQRVIFWKERKNLGAIARHTNAFKLNEDVVIPISVLPQFSQFIDALNYEKEVDNYCKSQRKIKEFIKEAKISEAFFVERQYRALSLFEKDNKIPDYEVLREIFNGYADFLKDLDDVFIFQRSRKIVIATHMHAGDGNIHVNIPVHSGDYEMMQEADKTAALVMEKTVELGGVISGEHGIGLTKLKFVDKDILDEYKAYKNSCDPEELFNPGKLSHDFAWDTIYTPSLNLMNKETFILETTELMSLTDSISACLRCGKCKGECNTQYPGGNTHYCPRNKILGVSLIIEAILYEALTSKALTLHNFRMLKEIASYCTMCHNCFAPCPVNIDFGNVTLFMRKLLKAKKRVKTKLLTQMTLFYLRRKGYKTNKLFRLALLRAGFSAQRAAYVVNRPVKALTHKISPTVSYLLDGKFSKSGEPTFREVFSLKQKDTFFSFENKTKEVFKSVFYFPGCGSERMFSEVSFAVLALLYNSGVRVVVPPTYFCCGYPLLANGKEELAQTVSSENKIIFHRIAETVSYMDISDIVISCGTCFEMLSDYNLNEIFADSQLVDINEFLMKEGLYQSISQDKEYLFHEPCHSPTKLAGSKKTLEYLLGARQVLISNCCGEGGTMALSYPEISAVLRSRKMINIGNGVSEKKVDVLTTCPSCLQGLSKIQTGLKVSGVSLAVKVACKHLGKNWLNEFLSHVKKENGIERIIF